MTAGGESDWPGVLFTDTFREKIKNSRVLAVGAGGIGCELLKSLVLSGFEKIEVIDLDTIETSNLNRQFLFRRSHVGQSKAKVAADVVQTFAPHARIKSYQANIKESRFSLDFFKSFDLVLNGLDNMDARRHVNRLCVAAGVPLVESGTAGYVGQVSVHLKGKTECYECNPRNNTTQKTFPICTLRNTPDKPIHCVVWAKELLFPRLFGKVEVSDLDEQAAAAPTSTEALEPAANSDAAAAANGNTEAAAAAAAATEAAEVASFFQRRDGEAPLEYAERVFERLYSYDIEKVLSMEELWKSRQPPTPLDLTQLLPDTESSTAISTAADSSHPSASKALNLSDQAVWSVQDSAHVFLTSIVKYLVQREKELGEAVFDKDDDLAVDFVTAASNLRAACYGITQQSRFDCKGMAGNIIHAIATTNAIVGGIIVVEALKLLAGLPSSCMTTFIRTVPGVVGTKRTGRMQCLISGEKPPAPSAQCMVCGKAALHLTVNTETTTLQQLIDKVLKQRLGFNMPSIDIGNTRIWDEADMADMEPDEIESERAKLPRSLSAAPAGGIRNGTCIAVDDDSQGLAVEIHVTHQDVIDQEQQPEGFILAGEAPAAAQQGQTAADMQPPAAVVEGKKRAREDDAGQQQQQQPPLKQLPANGQASDEEQQHDQQQAKRHKQQQQEDGNGAAAVAVAAAGTAGDAIEVLDSDDDCIVVE